MTSTARAPRAPSRAVLITGCSTGIGRATALRLVADGWPVFATARRTDSLAPLERAGCRVLPLDVTDESSMHAAVAEVERTHGAVGVLVNNAGYSQSGAVESVPIERVRVQFETNVFGAMRLVQLVAPGMRRQGRGCIVSLGSMGGKLTFPGAGYYHATKYALEALSDALRFELRGFGINVILIEPGLIRSHFAETVAAAMAPEADPESPYLDFHAEVGRITRESYVKGPLARLTGTPEDVAAVIARAVSDPHPKSRYTVSMSATALLTLRRLLSDGLWDRFLRRTFPTPVRTKP